MYATVIVLGTVAVALGLVDDPLDLSPGNRVRLGLAVATVVLAQLARVRVRIGAADVFLGWGEAALIILLYVLPSGWVPLATAVGMALAMLLLRLVGEPRTPLQMIYNTASLTLAGSAATLVGRAIHPLYRAHVTPSVAVALAGAGLAYSLVIIVLTSAALSLRVPAGFPLVAGRMVGDKLYMIVGNIAAGVLTVVIAGADPRWLAVVPPVLWLLRQSYAHRLHAHDERRGWQVFATVTRSLNQLDERGVVISGITGAVTLFSASQVEILVLRPDDTLWRYLGGADVEFTGGPVDGPEAEAFDHHAVPDPVDPPASPVTNALVDASFGLDASSGHGRPDESLATRTLAVGGIRVGELRLRFAGAVTLTPREQIQLSAFGDALAAALHDATSHRELQVMSARSAHQAMHDPVTGILNRAALLARGDAAMRLLNPDAPVALLLLDIDHFKEVNETLGHTAGDDLLRVTAARIGAAAGPGEMVARLGGDEFGMLLTALPVPDEDEAGALRHARTRARELANLLAIPTEVATVPLAVEVSIGAAVALVADTDITELLRRADVAMYQAKRGGGTIAWYDRMGDGGNTDRLALLAEMREALAASHQLVLALQPAVDLRTGAPTGVEALVRWRHPRRGELTPIDFVRAVEHSDLLGPFTEYIIDKALMIASEWGRQGLTVPISVNLSPRSLLDHDLPRRVAELLDRHRVPPDRLVVEITETVVVPEHPVVTDVLRALRRLGVQLSVDDFGTGYSSLTFLTRVRVDEVKIDRTFVAKMAESPEARAIVRTTVDLARELGLRVVGEGVETAEQRSVLADLGCRAAQGYHFFKPMPADKITATLCSMLDGAGGEVIPLRAEGA